RVWTSLRATRRPVLRLGGSGRAATDAGLTLGHAAVAADVSVLPTGDDVDCVAVTDVADLSVGRSIHADDAARPQRDLVAVAELELDVPAMDEIGLFLFVVEVDAGLVVRRHDDRVDAEGGHADRTPDLAEAGALPDRVDVRGG